MGAIAGAIATGVAELGAQGMSYAVNANGKRKSIRRAERANRALMDYQNDINLRNWNLQNEYNSPKAQMDRYRDAGLNPNLIYGQSNLANDVGNVSASMSPESAEMDLSGSAGRAVDAYTRISQTQQYNQTEEMKRKVMQSEIERNAAETVGKLLSNDKMTAEKPYWSKNASYQSEQFAKQVEIMNADAKQKLWQLLTGNTLVEKETNARVAKLEAEKDSILRNTDLDIKEKQKKIDFLDKQIFWYDEIQKSTLQLREAETLDREWSKMLKHQEWQYNEDNKEQRGNLLFGQALHNYWQGKIAEKDYNYYELNNSKSVTNLIKELLFGRKRK